LIHLGDGSHLLPAFSDNPFVLAFICGGYMVRLQSASILYTSMDKLPGDARCPFGGR